MHEEWALQEMNGAKVADARSRRFLGRLCQHLADQPHASFSAACGPAGRQAARRLFRRPDTGVPALLEGHFHQTAQRCAAHPLVLVAQDTTEFDYTAHPTVRGLGPTCNQHARGLFGHAALALTPAGEPLGLLHLELWARDPDTQGHTHTRRQRRTPEKESQKWGNGLAGVEKHLPEGPEVLLIQDREGDVFAFLATPRRPGVHLLLRAAQARKVRVPPEDAGDASAFGSGASPAAEPPATAPQEEEHTLLAQAARAPVVGELTVRLPAKTGGKGKREERDVTLVVRATVLEVQPPRHGKAGEPKTPQRVWVVQAREENPPAGLPAEEAVHWVLVSTRPVAHLGEAVTLVRYYALRWRIERLHYTLKSGCQVENLQHGTAEALMKVLALYYVVAWRLLWLTYTARTQPDRPAEAVFSPPELTVLRHAAKKPVRTAQEAVRAVAQLAGWQGYRSAPDPGVKMLWLGLRRLTDMVAGWRLVALQLPDPNQA